ncbi:LysR family transcriptional regulator [Labrys sp. LIt4]|uniref:LysR family transcriptional regulator n=1 Tax=Labrys sp. LIt4 TaxID=2821355 RepID=UPI001AE08B53|nr:LysR family transcriptional regulator [Labrys sp. LIt4]MBP0578684.1 LysR family transcriptional regulator [Labrys sp. LIt4]
MNRLNLDHLKAFADVVELGSFSAAADRLNLTQPAVSLQVRQLERRLGTALVERVGRKARPTAAGMELLRHAARIDAAVQEALEAVARQSEGVMGTVRIGTGATACIFLLPALLQSLRQRHPRLEIVITTGNTGEIARAVEDNRLDLALVTMPVSSRSLEIEPVFEDPFMVIAPPHTRLPAPASPAALADLPLLLFEPGGNTRRLTDDWFAQAGLSPRPVMSLGSVEAIKELVRAGLGCSILPGIAVRRDAASGALAVQPLSPPLSRRLAIIVRRDKPLHRGLKEILQALRQLPAAPPASAVSGTPCED